MLDVAARTLVGHLSGEFQRTLLSASLMSLRDPSNPLSFNNFCSGYRELVRHVLSDLAPDEAIRSCSWFVPDKTSKSGITRGHAIDFIVQGGLTRKYVSEVLKIDVLDERKRLLDAINTLHKYTHVNECTLGVDLSLAIAKAEAAINALSSVLILAGSCRVALASSLEVQIQDEIVASAISESIEAIDELSTHSSVEDIDVEEIVVTRVGSDYIEIQAHGSVGVNLQWGSNGDLSRDDGAETSESFPFSCALQSHVTSPTDLEVIEGTLSVDTSSWWDGYYD